MLLFECLEMQKRDKLRLQFGAPSFIRPQTQNRHGIGSPSQRHWSRFLFVMFRFAIRFLVCWHCAQGIESEGTVGAEAAFDQQVLLRGSELSASRMVWQRLELGAGGTVLFYQFMEGLLAPTVPKEGTSKVAPRDDTSPATPTKKKPVRKRYSASSLGR